MLGSLARSLGFAGLLVTLFAAPAWAQDEPEPPPPGPVAQTAGSAVGQAGHRQTRNAAAPNIEPMGRIDNRIANRVQSRIRNRIDRYYDPQANAASPFVIAGAQARATARPRRR